MVVSHFCGLAALVCAQPINFVVKKQASDRASGLLARVDQLLLEPPRGHMIHEPVGQV